MLDTRLYTIEITHDETGKVIYQEEGLSFEVARNRVRRHNEDENSETSIEMYTLER